MGMGDELMAAGHAARAHRETGKPVCIVNESGQVRYHELWDGLEFIVPARVPGAVEVRNGSGCRPYIRYPFTAEGHGYTDWRARDHRPVIATKREAAGGFVLIESTIKHGANPNKHWPRWQEVVDALPGVRFVQCSPAGGGLRGVETVRTATFMEAVRVLARVSLYVGPEGGMHHAAAALGVPAVVVFGGSPSIEATGYPDHVNFGCDDPCGRWSRCAHCAEVAERITPEDVAAAVKDKLQ